MIKSIGIAETLRQKLKPEHYSNLTAVEENEGEYVVRIAKPGKNRPQAVKSVFQDKYCRVITGEKEGRAEMFLYGFIGQDFWWDSELNEESITDLAFVKAIRKLEKEYNRIDVRINSPGGSVFHGDPIITAIRNSKAEVHTYIDGIAASMAFDIWLAGDVRHAAINSKAMIHSTSTIAIGTAQDMRETAEQLDAFDNAAIATFAKAADMEEEEIRAMFYDYKDHWKTATELEDLGLIEKVEDYDTKEIAGAEKMTVAELNRAFAEILQEKEEQTREKKEEKQYTENDLLAEVKKLFGEDAQIIVKPIKESQEEEVQGKKQEEAEPEKETKTIEDYERRLKLLKNQMVL